jgi:hypothetical protein
MSECSRPCIKPGPILKRSYPTYSALSWRANRPNKPRSPNDVVSGPRADQRARRPQRRGPCRCRAHDPRGQRANAGRQQYAAGTGFCVSNCRCTLISATDRYHAAEWCAKGTRTAIRSGSWQRLAAAEQIPDDCQGRDQQHAHEDAPADAVHSPRSRYRRTASLILARSCRLEGSVNFLVLI